MSVVQSTAPSAVPTVHLMRSTADTLSLSWLPPEKPNGVILDYEIKYHERVRSGFSPIILMSMTDGLTLKILLAALRWLRNDFVGAGKKKRKKLISKYDVFPGSAAALVSIRFLQKDPADTRQM